MAITYVMRTFIGATRRALATKLRHAGMSFGALLLTFSAIFCSSVVCAHTIVSKTTSTPNVTVGGVATYQITVNSAGQSAQSLLMRVVDTLPYGFSYRSTQSIQFFNGAMFSPSVTPSYPSAGDTSPTWGRFDNPADSSTGAPASYFVITFDANVANPVCSASIGSPTGNTAQVPDDSATVPGHSQHAVLIPAINQAPETVLGPAPIITVNKTTSTPVVLNTGSGMTATYTITVSVQGGGCAATGVSITDNLPSGFSYASTGAITFSGSPASGNRTGGANPTIGATSPTWTGFTIPGSGSVSITFTANIANGTANGTYYNTTVAVPAEAGATVTNFGPGAPVQLVGASITKAFSPSLVQVGANSQLRFTLTKATGGVLSGIGFTDNLPTNLVVSGTPVASQCGGNVTAAGGAVTVTGASLGTGAASCNIDLNVASSVPGTYLNNSSNFTNVAPTSTSATGANATLTVTNATLSKAFLTPVVGINGTSVLRFTLFNAAGGAADTGLGFVDTLPAGLQVVAGFAASQCGGTVSTTGPQNISFTGGTLPAGGASGSSCTIDVTVRGTNSGTYTNTASNISALTGGLSPISGLSAALTVRGTILEKGFSPTDVSTGTSSTMTFTINNSAGNPSQSGLAFTETLPPGLTLSAVPVTPQCGGAVSGSVGGTTLTFSGGALASGISICSISASVSSATPGTYVNDASRISGASAGMDTSGVSATLAVGSPILSKAFANSPVGVNSAVALRFTLTNGTGNPPQSGIAFTDTFPAGLVTAASQPAAPFSAGCSGTLQDLAGGAIGAGDTGVKLVAGSITAGTASCTITVNVQSATPGLYINNATNISNTSTGLLSSGVNAALQVSGVTLTVNKSTSTPFIDIVGTNNGLATYTINVINTGTADAAGVRITDVLPSGFTFASTGAITLSGGATRTSVSNPTAGAASPVWGVFSIPGSGGVSIVFDATVPNSQASNTYDNSASVTTTTSGAVIQNFNGANSTADNVTVRRLADLTIAKTQTTANPVVQGQAGVQYSITVSNTGGAAKAAGNTVTVTEAPPTGITVTALSGTGWTCSLGTRTCTRTDLLNSGASYPAITVTVDVDNTAPSSVVNSSTVALSGQSESNPNNNTGNAPATQVTARPDLIITKSHSGNFSQGQSGAQYTLQVSTAATSGIISVGPIQVVDSLPVGMTATALSGGATWTCVLGTLSCTYAGTFPLTPGTSLAPITLTVSVSATATASITNSATVNTLSSESVTANNTGSDPTTINQVDLAMNKAQVTANPISQGQTGVQYTLQVTNVGQAPKIAGATVSVVESPPTGLVVTGLSGTNWTCSVPTATCSRSDVLAAGASYAELITVTADVANNAPSSLVNSAAVTVSGQLDSNAANNPGGVTTSIAAAYSVSGFVYSDTNHNGTMDGAETGTGLTLFAKLVSSTSPSGPATRVASVNPANGSYSFYPVIAGTYSIVIDDNSTPADVTPNLPTGWIGTEVPTQVRAGVGVSAANLLGQNFGLFNGSKVTGTVFKDTGIGSGTANDGIKNGGETGIAGVVVTAAHASCPAGTCDTTSTDTTGSFMLWIPSTVAGTTVRITESNLGGYLSTGGQAGSTGGTYTRTTDTVAFTNTVGTSYSGVTFGDVPSNTFLTDGTRNGPAGTVLYFTHAFIAETGGNVGFTSSHVASPNISGWSSLIYLDANCNGTLDGSEGTSTLSSLPVTAGQVACLLVKQTVPAGAPVGAGDVVTVTATFAYTNAIPSLAAVYSRTDTTTVVSTGTGGLTLFKEVDKSSARPNEVLTYTITYTNTTAAAITNVVIHDTTPAFTTYVGASAVCPLVVPGTSCTVQNQPAGGAAGPVVWSVTGSVPSGVSGTVRYQVRVQQ